VKEVPLEAPTENAVTEDVSAPMTIRVNFILRNIHLTIGCYFQNIWQKLNNDGYVEVVTSFSRSGVQIRKNRSSTWRKRVPRVIIQ